MRKRVFLVVLLVIHFTYPIYAQMKPMSEVVDNALSLAEKQSLLMARKYLAQDELLPRSFENGKMSTSTSRWWTSGFYPGLLWYLYENNKTQELLDCAQNYTRRIEREKYTTNNHDIGFMLYCSFGNGVRITGNATYNEVLLTGAKSLATRYDKKVGLIRSWDFNKNIWQYPVIIDNMMNLELLLWAAKYSGDNTYYEMAVSHADKTMKHHYRPDMSCYHVVSYDTITGRPHLKQTNQGCADESAWARGQAWGLYGYTFMYRETKDKRYLKRAQKIAHFMINHKNMPDDMVPYWDYDAPHIPNEPRDASTAAIMASALIELSRYVSPAKKKEYMSVAEKQIRTLASPSYTANIGENGHFILLHSTGNYPRKSEIDAPLTYADYYYVEALMRWKNSENKKLF